VKITDEVADILYHNDENGYSVLRLKQSGVTATGVFAYVASGQEMNLEGDYVNNAKYGMQFKVTGYEVLPPNTPAKIMAFIGSGLIDGIGPVTAERIVKTFGKDTLKIMENAPEELIAVRGVSLKKAKVIGEKYAGIKQMQASILFLQKFEISLNMAMKIYKFYGERTVERVQSNPYSLIETIDGIGFITADKMARELGIPYDGVFRVRAGAVYTLKVASDQDGHTFLPKEKLSADVCKLLRIKMDDLQNVLNQVLYELCLEKYLTAIGEGYALTKFYNAEKSIATRLNMLAIKKDNDNLPDDKLDKLINHYERNRKIKLHDKQKQAVKQAVTSGVCVITGGPGTGKTTIVNAILYVNKAEGLVTKLLAPTGRAAKRMEETTGLEASTIHRALDLDFGGADKRAFGYDETEALECDVVIIDEFSMCDSQLTNHLLKKILPGTRIIIVGDIDQLPSVGAGSVLGDIIDSGIISTVRLTEIYRQTEKSEIVFSAHAINNGKMPDLSNTSSDFFFASASSPLQIREKVVNLTTGRIQKYFTDYTPQIQILTPMKAGEAGMNAINIALQEALNPPDIDKSEYEFGQMQKTLFRLGDRVMQTANNYNQEWRKDGVEGSGVYNGDIGSIIGINRHNGEIVVELEDGRITTYMRTDLANLVLAYAITVHKSQGCEFDVVIVPVTSGAYMILTRNLLYTAVTRAKKMVVLVGDAANIEKMVKNTYIQKRFTMLKNFLVEMKDKTEAFYSE